MMSRKQACEDTGKDFLKGEWKMESFDIGRNFICSRDRENANIDALVEQGVVWVQGKLKREIYVDRQP